MNVIFLHVIILIFVLFDREKIIPETIFYNARKDDKISNGEIFFIPYLKERTQIFINFFLKNFINIDITINNKYLIYK